jgi:2-phospho-L-lactate/phosphoenolpyruvate guanylyltransferase
MSGPDGTVVIVAVQDAGRAKSRLGPDLDPGTRRTLVIAMLDDLLTALREAHTGPVLVVSADAVYDAVAREHGAAVLRDAGTGYNEAVIAALERSAGAPAALTLPGDLPHASTTDLRAAIEALEEPGVVIVPSDDGGTSALGLHPPDVITPAFGPNSAARHREAAEAAGVRCQVLELESLRVDVDTLEDLARVWRSAGEATTALLEHLPLPAPPSSRGASP